LIPDRGFEDLSHLSNMVGAIGRLQTLSCLPVLPGDGFSQDIVGGLRLSPLRRGMTMDSNVDICTFYVPHRHIYGENWIDFIEQGWDESVTLATDQVNTSAQPVTPVNCLGAGSLGAGLTFPLWYSAGYREIWNQFYRPPTTVAERTDAVANWTTDERLYGFRCAQLKSLWTAMLQNDVTSSDYNVSTAGNVLSILDLDAQRGYLKTEQERAFFNVRYRDIISSFGGRTTIDADVRPDLLMRSTFFASGYDVDGTTEVSLGQYAGRVVQGFRHQVPRWHVPEHGCIWTMMLVRFPVVHERENPFFVNNPNPTYAQLAGDPELVATQPPSGLRLSDVFSESNDNTVRGYVPFAQWYRTHPNLVHNTFDALNGFPFLTSVPANQSEMVLVEPNAYDAMFQSNQLRHWQVHCRIGCNVARRLPSARSSLLAGA